MKLFRYQAIKFTLGKLLLIANVVILAQLIATNAHNVGISKQATTLSRQHNELNRISNVVVEDHNGYSHASDVDAAVSPALYEDEDVALFRSNATSSRNKSRTYTNRFAVRIKRNADPDVIANELGFTNMGRIGSLDNYYLFIGHHISKRSLDLHDDSHSDFSQHEHVDWYEQQHVRRRVKRDLILDMPSARPINGSSAHQLKSRTVKYSDPLFEKQWYFNNGARGGYDMNVAGVWKMGITGKGVVLTILDDGVQADHPDLMRNYDKKASYDINSGDDNPTPQDNGENKHGTRCAGEIAAEAGNEYCGVGVAYNSGIGGVRMLDGTVTDEVEATALSLNPNHIDVYSASWGPDDNGKTVDGPGHLAAAAFVAGVRNGRKGRGSIFVWASGNGGKKQDNCNCDGYTNSIYTLSISSATQRGQKPWYLEECSSTLATTYSSGTPTKDENIVTADQSNEYADALRENRKPDPAKFCTQVHTGTSASAPIAAGIVALALEANPELTWRDMQHLVVQTSRYEPLRHESGWVPNAVGRHVSHKFGYGLMDAEAMVKLAMRWKTTPPQVICRTSVDNKERLIQDDLIVTMNTSACAGTDSAVNYLEHVQARISLKFQPRGNLRITLISPSGTPSHLLMSRPRDLDEDTFDKWPFMTVHFWGEKPQGTWKIIIRNENRRRIADQQGTLYSWSLVFYGTTTPPQDNVPLNNVTSQQQQQQPGRILPRRTYDQSSFNMHDDAIVSNDMSVAEADAHLLSLHGKLLNSDGTKPTLGWRAFGAPTWLVSLAVVSSIFVITVLVFAAVVSIVRMGSKVAGNIELRLRTSPGSSNGRTRGTQQGNGSSSAAARASTSSASYTKLESETNLDC